MYIAGLLVGCLPSTPVDFHRHRGENCGSVVREQQVCASDVFLERLVSHLAVATKRKTREHAQKR